MTVSTHQQGPARLLARPMKGSDIPEKFVGEATDKNLKFNISIPDLFSEIKEQINIVFCIYIRGT